MNMNMEVKLINRNLLRITIPRGLGYIEIHDEAHLPIKVTFNIKKTFDITALDLLYNAIKETRKIVNLCYDGMALEDAIEGS
jgi:hypothetical protein